MFAPALQRACRTAAATAVVLIGSLASVTSVDPAFPTYSVANIGAVPGVPTPYGGLAFIGADNLLIGGGANGAGGSIYLVQVSRNASDHIVGFGTVTCLSPAPFSDEGGLCYD